MLKSREIQTHVVGCIRVHDVKVSKRRPCCAFLRKLRSAHAVMNSTKYLDSVQNVTPLASTWSHTFDPVDVIDEAEVCENNSQPVFKLSGSQRGVLEAAVYVVPERLVFNLRPMSDSCLTKWTLTILERLRVVH